MCFLCSTKAHLYPSPPPWRRRPPPPRRRRPPPGRRRSTVGWRRAIPTMRIHPRRRAVGALVVRRRRRIKIPRWPVVGPGRGRAIPAVRVPRRRWPSGRNAVVGAVGGRCVATPRWRQRRWAPVVGLPRRRWAPCRRRRTVRVVVVRRRGHWLPRIGVPRGRRDGSVGGQRPSPRGIRVRIGGRGASLGPVRRRWRPVPVVGLHPGRAPSPLRWRREPRRRMAVVPRRGPVRAPRRGPSPQTMVAVGGLLVPRRRRAVAYVLSSVAPGSFPIPFLRVPSLRRPAAPVGLVVRPGRWTSVLGVPPVRRPPVPVIPSCRRSSPLQGAPPLLRPRTPTPRSVTASAPLSTPTPRSAAASIRAPTPCTHAPPLRASSPSTHAPPTPSPAPVTTGQLVPSSPSPTTSEGTPSPSPTQGRGSPARGADTQPLDLARLHAFRDVRRRNVWQSKLFDAGLQTHLTQRVVLPDESNPPALPPIGYHDGRDAALDLRKGRAIQCQSVGLPRGDNTRRRRRRRFLG